MGNKNKTSPGKQISSFVKRCIYFVTYEIWRITGNEISGIKGIYINVIKTTILAVRGFMNENLPTKASALTYSSLLAVVPLLAVLIGIAKGFGFQNVMHQELLDYFPGHEAEMGIALEFVESYLSQAQGGVFIGVGLLLLFYTVITLISSIEDTFNSIWQISKPRPWKRKILDYMALFLILPVMMTASSGFSIFVSTLQNTFLSDYMFFTPMMNNLLKIAPFLIASLTFSSIYILLPNTKVGLLNGLIPGVIAGCSFQLFQVIYINGQIWVSKYNAIYGSFAALPLLLLWLQLSWLICLFGAELSYASQNVKKFSFERDSRNISRRYKDFLTLLIASLIVKRFAKGEKPYAADELSDLYRIPLRLTTQILLLLSELNIIIEVNYGNDDRITHYQPAIDINMLSVGYLLSKMDEYGSENFKIDTGIKFRNEWETILKTRRDLVLTGNSILLKDL
ncbi:MAG: YihY/virulence factor BrkB family protein [Tannerellaceae bacterium]|nr:YihY/virulence factor BrkB family protein [Tannerellaceae bacterium]